MARDEKTCKTNADCNGIRCPKAIIRTEYVQCIRGVCQCPSKRRAVLSDDTNSNCGVAACIDYFKAKGEVAYACLFNHCYCRKLPM
ncbi:hypothetical protein Bca52824_089085 [Brassica carinata]|uniref:Uncharacterized protein n=2 Tax=Brassica TaxID=3705 RepID=A0A0D3A3V6_BRAOL|nr:hypothetical protein Bca52824_089085 [Brassica carinata]